MDVTFYTRRNCPLCDKARAAIAASGVQVELIEVDIDDDPDLQKRFTDDVPVVYVNGSEAFRHFVDPEAFAAYVRGAGDAPLADQTPPADPLPLAYDEIRALMGQLPGWIFFNAHDIRREFKFPDFATALAFTNRIGAIAEELNHHPEIVLGWGKVMVMTWTHSVSGMSRADFILAARIERAVSSSGSKIN
jgi:4a-hydroxytetrahydrobiopterin dehydratase